MMSQEKDIRVVLFDLGGVLVELAGVPIMLALLGNRLSQDELLTMWLKSPAVRAFETGRLTPEIFADQLIVEMSLPIGRDQLLVEVSRWAVGLFPGALDVVARVPRKYQRATLSNTNALHWPRLMQEMQLAGAFDHHFASHLTGKIKPDEDAFHQITKTLHCSADEVLFLDDSRLNVDAAKRIGMRAVQAKGIKETERILVDNGVLVN